MSKDSRKPAPFETEAEANVLLRAVADQAGFKDFQARVDATRKMKKVKLRVRKRIGSEAFSFSPHEKDPSKVNYLYSDGASTGRCHWSTLWRAVRVELTERVTDGTPDEAKP